MTVDSLYDLMDSAYDAQIIIEHSLGWAMCS